MPCEGVGLVFMRSRWNLRRLNPGITDACNYRPDNLAAVVKLFACTFGVEIKTGGGKRHPETRQLIISEDQEIEKPL